MLLKTITGIKQKIDILEEIVTNIVPTQITKTNKIIHKLNINWQEQEIESFNFIEDQEDFMPNSNQTKLLEAQSQTKLLEAQSQTKLLDKNICTICHKHQDPVKGAKVIAYSNDKFWKTICYFCQQKM